MKPREITVTVADIPSFGFEVGATVDVADELFTIAARDKAARTLTLRRPPAWKRAWWRVRFALRRSS